MPRKPREISSSGIYHVVLRSVNQHIIFEEDSDYLKFLYILSDCNDKYNIDILAYCLMDNHIHLLINSQFQNLSHFFQSLGSRFARWYNDKYERRGHLFQERYHSRAINTRKHYYAALIYIHNNPVKAGMCRYASEYRWSSHAAFYGKVNEIVNVDYSYKMAGSKESLLHLFASNDLDSEIDSYFGNVHASTRRYQTDERALEIFYSVTKLKNTSEAVHLTKIQRNEYVRILVDKGLTHSQITRLMGISATTIKRITKMVP